ncbi:hypothetical protein MBLNU457_3180t1 [Dothideomycetes sp. NU457]
MLVHAFLAALSVASALTIARPNGTYSVGTQITEYVDDTRFINGTYRRIMGTSFCPVGRYADCSPYLVPYMPKLTADYNAIVYGGELGTTLPNNTFAQFRLQVCNATCLGGRIEHKPWPLTLFSPGLGASRQFYSVMAEQLASMGYIVVTIDTPLQADIIEYPDGSYLIAPGIGTDAQLTAAVPDRVEDIIFVKNKVLVGVGLPSHVKADANRIAVWGHSFGGAAAAQVALKDSSFKAGVDLDGILYGSVATTGVAQPFLFFARSTPPDIQNMTSWRTFLQASPDYNKLVLQLNNSAHGTFSDFPLLADLSGIARVPGASALIGNLSGRRALMILASYVDAFFRFAFSHRVPDLLEGPSPAFPEVSYVSRPL